MYQSFPFMSKSPQFFRRFVAPSVILLNAHFFVVDLFSYEKKTDEPAIPRPSSLEQRRKNR